MAIVQSTAGTFPQWFMFDDYAEVLQDHSHGDIVHWPLFALGQYLRATGDVADGIDVRGYLHWSALDNYEWGTFAPTFGLIGWDKETFERHPKPSATWLGEVAKSGELTHPHR